MAAVSETGRTIYGLEIPDEVIMEMFGREIGRLTIREAGIGSAFRHPAEQLVGWAGASLPLHERAGYDQVDGMWRLSAVAIIKSLATSAEIEGRLGPDGQMHLVRYWDDHFQLADPAKRRQMYLVNRKDARPPELDEVA